MTQHRNDTTSEKNYFITYSVALRPTLGHL